MSDYHRTVLGLTVVDTPVAEVVSALYGWFHEQGLDLLANEVRFLAYDESPNKYTEADAAPRLHGPPTTVADLLEVAARVGNVGFVTEFPIGDRSYEGLLEIFGHATPNGGTFVRFAFESALVYQLRGNREFGSWVRVDERSKSAFLDLIVGLATACGADGFVYGFGRGEEPDELLPVTVDDVLGKLREPGEDTLPGMLRAVRSSLIDADELLQVWKSPNVIKEYGGYSAIDILHDRDGV